nr:PfkB family carbohydrate kinase [uncultured Oscillibacter sp.]
MTHEGVRRATYQAVDCAKKNGAIISFDPNLRSPLWDTMDNARGQIECGLSKCDILKIADNELEFMTGTTDFDRARRSCGRRFPTFVC